MRSGEGGTAHRDRGGAGGLGGHEGDRWAVDAAGGSAAQWGCPEPSAGRVWKPQ